MPEAPPDTSRHEVATLLGSIFALAAAALVYELLLATVASYLLGDSVTQFSIAIGLFVGAMGLGSHLSQRVTGSLLEIFVALELALGLVGGVSVALVFFAYGQGPVYWAALLGSIVVIGGLVGLELPILARLLRPYGSFRTAIAQALSFDYVGALVGSLLFPLVLLPSLGVVRTAFLMGLLNVAVAAYSLRVFGEQLRGLRQLRAACAAVGIVLVAGLGYGDPLYRWLERRLYDDEVVFSAQTPYQRLVITRWREDLRLFIDGNLQFSAVDEYRYHEALVHPALALAARPESVLVLGGGDGLGVRELLKHPAVKSVTVVDIDPEVTRLGRELGPLVRANEGALLDPRVRIRNEDALKVLEADAALYDVIVADLPDPNNDALAKLYSVETLRLAKRHLARQGVFVTQATSPFASRAAFWCIDATLREAGFHTRPYHAYVPSFGDWGFILGTHDAREPRPLELTVPTRFLTNEMVPSLFVFGKDAGPVAVPASTLDRPIVLELYLRGASQWE